MHNLLVYPRLRGGSARSAFFASGRTGISPPTRGIPSDPAALTVMLWSIPAYAGDPCAQNRLREVIVVYPRLRGGSTGGNVFGPFIPGLSPPTRGIPLRRQRLAHGQRSIPAYAGDPRVSDLSPAR